MQRRDREASLVDVGISTGGIGIGIEQAATGDDRVQQGRGGGRRDARRPGEDDRDGRKNEGDCRSRHVRVHHAADCERSDGWSVPFRVTESAPAPDGRAFGIMRSESCGLLPGGVI